MSKTGKPLLYLVTSDFPFGNSEDSYIIPELPYLTEKFDVTVISTSLYPEQTIFPDEEIRVIHYDRKASLIRKILDSVCYLLTVSSCEEIIDILRCKKKILGRLFESLLFFEEARRFQRFIEREELVREEEPIIVYCYWFTYFCLTMLNFSKKHPNIKVITRAHGYDLYDERTRFGRQPFKKQMNRRISHIIFIAEYGKQYYINKYGYAGKKEQYQTFRLGVRPLGKCMASKERGDFLLVSCSTVIPLKRVELIVDALTEINDISITWVHFGEGSGYAQLCRYAHEKLDHMENISFDLKGYVAYEQIMRFYQENYVDAFITTTESEGCPVAIQEAMSYGIPVIGTEVAEIPYMIKGNGVLLGASPTKKEIADAIRNVYGKSSEEIRGMREQSYRIWHESFDLEKNATEFSRFLKSIADANTEER